MGISLRLRNFRGHPRLRKFDRYMRGSSAVVPRPTVSSDARLA